jgi:molybdenum cofactor cytidylyltransferase
MTGDRNSLWTIVLAAGGSSRLGRPKQFIRLGGRTLLARSVAIAEHVTPSHVIVVVGASRARARIVVRRCAPRATVVVNAQWRDGMSGSLARGLEALPETAQAALLLTVDQPLVTERHLNRLIALWSRRPSRAAAASYASRVGVPAILTRQIWKAARHASGDVGAREILRSNGDRVTNVELPEAAIDVDTPKDLARIAM